MFSCLCFEHQFFICFVIFQRNFWLKIFGHTKTNEKADGMVSLEKVLKKLLGNSLHFLIKNNLFNTINKRRTMRFFNSWICNQCSRLSIISWSVKPRAAQIKFILPCAFSRAVGIPKSGD
jgi:hypothetical protein